METSQAAAMPDLIEDDAQPTVPCRILEEGVTASTTTERRIDSGQRMQHKRETDTGTSGWLTQRKPDATPAPPVVGFQVIFALSPARGNPTPIAFFRNTG